MYHARLGIDLDGVIAEFVESYVEFINKVKGTCFTKEQAHQSWNFTDSLGLSNEEEKYFMKSFINSGRFKLLKVLEQAKESIIELSSFYRLFAVTSRPNDYWLDTNVWMRKHFGPYFHGVIFLTSGKSKGEVCREYGIRALIEDSEKHALSAVNNGVFVFLIDYPHNRGIETKIPEEKRHLLIRVRDIREATDILTKQRLKLF
jgi:uncharacterized HAD superfamily protein